MGDVLRQADCQFKERTEMQRSAARMIPQRKRIIKAGETRFAQSKRVIKHTQPINCEQPIVRPIQSGDRIEGVEIRCRCGEKMIIHFDLE